MINGKAYDWEDISVVLPTGDVVHFSSIEYSDSQEHRAVYGKGTKPRAYSRGNYEAEWSVTMRREEFNKLTALAAAGGIAVRELGPFPITVSYANVDQGTTTDVLPVCLIDEISSGGEQEAEQIDVEISGPVMEPIIWSGAPGA